MADRTVTDMNIIRGLFHNRLLKVLPSSCIFSCNNTTSLVSKSASIYNDVAICHSTEVSVTTSRPRVWTSLIWVAQSAML